jgi:hypothetical protein
VFNAQNPLKTCNRLISSVIGPCASYGVISNTVPQPVIPSFEQEPEPP